MALKHAVTGFLASLLLLAGGASAQDRPVVVELFTSQGCSSCPPADALLHDLAAREGVIALALHVDYWDYIGWKDVFADPANADRQRVYASVAGRRMVYTPQMVINGRDDVVGNRPHDVDALIRKHRGKDAYVDLKVVRSGHTLTISARAMDGLSGKLDIQVAHFVPKRSVKITRGENAGRTISYANVVTDLIEVGEWDARSPLELSTQVRGDGPLVVLVQRDGHGEIEAAQVVR